MLWRRVKFWNLLPEGIAALDQFALFPQILTGGVQAAGVCVLQQNWAIRTGSTKQTSTPWACRKQAGSVSPLAGRQRPRWIRTMFHQPAEERPEVGFGVAEGDWRARSPASR
jgi:hypothetical protein